MYNIEIWTAMDKLNHPSTNGKADIKSVFFLPIFSIQYPAKGAPATAPIYMFVLCINFAEFPSFVNATNTILIFTVIKDPIHEISLVTRSGKWPLALTEGSAGELHPKTLPRLKAPTVTIFTTCQIIVIEYKTGTV